MKIIQEKNILKENIDTAVIFAEKERFEEVAAKYDAVKEYVGSEYFDGDKAKKVSVPVLNGGKKIKYILSSVENDASVEDILDAFGKVAKEFSSDKAKKVFVDISSTSIADSEDKVIAALKGLYHGSYSFNKFFTEKSVEEPDEILFYSDGKVSEEVLNHAEAINESILLAKRLVDEPANIMTPKAIAKAAEESLKDSVVETVVYRPEEIENLGMTLFLSVAKGAEHEPRLIVMKYMGDPDSKEITGLIGKGLAYDTGGYSLKPTNYMASMKSDMGGAAAVIGAMNLIAYEKPKKNIIGVVATCENRISGGAYLPGDIIKSMNGKTVEIGNTDAEGRLTLADAMTYAIRKEGATKVVDICTLTGACVAALGEEYAGVVTKEDELWDKASKAAQSSLDACWRLPINKRIIDANKSKVADLTNIGGQPGCETAGAFVGEFSEGLPWIHFDIAGTALVEKEKEYLRPGATGFGVHLLSELAKEL